MSSGAHPARLSAITIAPFAAAGRSRSTLQAAAESTPIKLAFLDFAIVPIKRCAYSRSKQIKTESYLFDTIIALQDDGRGVDYKVGSMLTYTRRVTAKDFLDHTAPAARALFHAISEEEARYKLINESLEGAHRLYYSDFITADLNEDFDQVNVQHKFMQAAEAKMQALLISQSVEVLCGSVFQIGRQGISLILKNKDKYSRGRGIGSQHLSNLIWHGRNQAMHWEEGVPANKYTTACFETLKNDFGPQFDIGVSPKSMAWNLWAVVGWNSYEKFEQDMRGILG